MKEQVDEQWSGCQNEFPSPRRGPSSGLLQRKKEGKKVDGKENKREHRRNERRKAGRTRSHPIHTFKASNVTNWVELEVWATEGNRRLVWTRMGEKQSLM